VPPRPVRMRLSVLSVPPSLGASLAICYLERKNRAVRPAGDRCREMQACSTLVHHITSNQACAALLHTNVKPNYMNTGAKTKTPKFVTQQTAPSLRRRGRGAGREIDTRHPEIGRPC